MIRNMNSKMTTNLQLSTTEPKKMKTKTRTETESEKWRSHGGLSVRRRRGRLGGKVQGIRNIIDKHKIDRGRLRIV